MIFLVVAGLAERWVVAHWIDYLSAGEDEYRA